MLQKQQLYTKIPKPINQWDIRDVTVFLQLNHITATQYKFSRHILIVLVERGVDGSKLLQLTPQILQVEYRISSKMVIRTIMQWIKNQSQDFDQYVRNIAQKQNLSSKKNSNQQGSKQKLCEVQIENPRKQLQNKQFNKNTEEKIENRVKSVLFFPKQLQIYDNNPLKSFQIFKKQPQYVKFIQSQLQMNAIKANMRLVLKYERKQYEIPHTVKLGRHNLNEIIIKDQSVSRYHAQIIQREGKYYLKDIGSRFGTYYRNSNKNPLRQNQIYFIGNIQIQFQEISIRKKQISQFGGGSTFSCRVKTVNCEKVRSKYIQNKAQAILGDSHGKKQFPFDDDSLENLHARIVLQNDMLFIQEINGTVMLKLAKQQQLWIKEDLDLKFGTCSVKVFLQEYCQKCKKSLINCLCQ